MEKNIFEDFTNLYSLSKTLRFELIPQGKTLEHIERNGLLFQDEERAKEYQNAKKIIDKYHQHFIEEVLKSVEIEKSLLEEYETLYFLMKKGEEEKILKELENIKSKIQKNISKQIEKHPRKKNLFSKELIDGGKKEEADIIEWLFSCKENNLTLFEDTEIGNVENAIEIIKQFKGWTTYFGGFHTNRENVYSDKDIPTSIIFRIVHDNLPKFLEDRDKFKQIQMNYPNLLQQKEIEENFMAELIFENKDCSTKLFSIVEVFQLENFNLFLNQSGIDKYNTLIGGKFIEGEVQKRKGINEYINLYSQQQNEKQVIKSIKKLKMVPLFKQILSDRSSNSFVLDKFSNDGQVVSAIDYYFQTLEEELEKHSFSEIIELLFSSDHFMDYDFSKLYIKNGQGLSALSE